MSAFNYLLPVSASVQVYIKYNIIIFLWYIAAVGIILY